jgi:hypothetical protein
MAEQPGITWYEVLGVVPGTAADRIRRRYEERAALLRAEMPVDGLVVDQSPRAPGRVRRGGAVTVHVWHPPAAGPGAR